MAAAVVVVAVVAERRVNATRVGSSESREIRETTWMTMTREDEDGRRDQASALLAEAGVVVVFVVVFVFVVVVFAVVF